MGFAETPARQGEPRRELIRCRPGSSTRIARIARRTHPSLASLRCTEIDLDEMNTGNEHKGLVGDAQEIPLEDALELGEKSPGRPTAKPPGPGRAGEKLRQQLRVAASILD